MEINCIAERQKAFFEKNRTKAYEFRKKALLRLKRTILYYEKEIEEALYKDLGKSDFEAYMTEVGMTLSELNYAERAELCRKAFKGLDEGKTCLDTIGAVSCKKL